MKLDQTSNQDKGQHNSHQKSLCKTTVQQKTYKIGMAVFRSDIRQRQHISNFNGLVLEVLEKDIWTLKGLDNNKQSRWPNVFSFMKETFIKQLHFQKNPQILKQIQTITFHQLKQLNLFVSNIQNYQALAFLSTPKLQKINLIYNNCTNFKALNKVYMPSVKIICIYLRQTARLNGVMELQVIQSFSIQDFQRWGFELNELRLQKSPQDRVMMEDLSRLAKAKHTLEKVYYCQNFRIQQKEVMRSIKNKGAVKFHTVQGDNFQFQQLNL